MLCSPIRNRTLLSGLKVQSIHHQCFGGIFAKVEVVLPQGLEPWIHSLRDCCFNQFSYRSLLRLGGGTWTHESSDLQSVPLATLVLQDSTGRGDWTHMQPITLSTVYKTEGICQYIGVLDGIWTHAIRSHNPLLYLTELLTQCWWKDSNFQLLPYESSLLPLKYINIYSLKTRN